MKTAYNLTPIYLTPLCTLQKADRIFQKNESEETNIFLQLQNQYFTASTFSESGKDYK